MNTMSSPTAYTPTAIPTYHIPHNLLHSLELHTDTTTQHPVDEIRRMGLGPPDFISNMRTNMNMIGEIWEINTEIIP